MSYESSKITDQMAAQLGALSDAAKYKAAAKAHKEALSQITRDSYAYGGVEGYSISDYTTWK